MTIYGFYHPDLVRLAFVLGIAISIAFYERRHLTTGGIAVPGYLAFGLFEPVILPALFLAALATHGIVHLGLARRYTMPSQVVFALLVIVSSAIHLAADLILVTFTEVTANSSLLRGIGYVVPGLVAHDFRRNGLRKTSLNIGLTSGLVALSILACLPLFPEFRFADTSPARDAFPIGLAFLPVLIFMSLIAWIGIVRTHDLRSGGVLGAGFLALIVLQPTELVRFAAAAVATLILVRALKRVAILFGRRLFAAHMLVGSCLSWSVYRASELHYAADTISTLTPSLAVVGVLVTGLLSHDMDRAGFLVTGLGAILSVSFTLCGTLMIVEAATWQRLPVLLPLLAIFTAAILLMSLTPARLARIWPGLFSKRTSP